MTRLHSALTLLTLLLLSSPAFAHHGPSAALWHLLAHHPIVVLTLLVALTAAITGLTHTITPAPNARKGLRDDREA
ncbi:MAG: hypothetical protein ACFCUG_11700 [Thiotrichales bacterium]